MAPWSVPAGPLRTPSITRTERIREPASIFAGMKIWWKTALLAGCAAAGAQAQTGNATADSAAAARSAYARATRADDLAMARREIDRAAAAWPTQQAYLWASATLAARAGDSAAAFGALQRYADLSLGRDLSGARDFARFRESARYQQLVTAHANNIRPLAASRIVLQLADSTLWPEAADFDARSRTWYIGSVRRGRVMRIDSAGGATELTLSDSLRPSAVLGVRVDAARGALWVTTSGIPQTEGFQPGDSSLAALIRIDLASGRVSRRWDFPVARKGHTLGDLTIAPNGDVYVTDSNHPVLYRLRASGDTIDAITSPLFYSLQGVAATPDDRTLYIADYSHGILRLDIASGTITRLGDPPRFTTLGCDGLAWYRGSLIAVQNGVAPARVVRFQLSDDGKAITAGEVLDRNTAFADEPTIGTIVGDEFVYVANSQWEKHDDAGQLRAGVRLTGPVLLGVKIR